MALIEEIQDWEGGYGQDPPPSPSLDPRSTDASDSPGSPREHVSAPFNVEEAEAIKLRGNDAYQLQNYLEATRLYTDAIALVPPGSNESSVFHANRAASNLAMEKYSDAVKDCTKALEINDHYEKALLRRSSAYEKLDELEKALEDAKKAQELNDGPNSRKIIRRLEPQVEMRREKMKEEMIGKLKDMGNSFLSNFGMSLDNFSAQKDPETGSYNISMK